MVTAPRSCAAKMLLCACVLVASARCAPAPPALSDDVAMRLVAEVRAIEQQIALGDCLDPSAYSATMRSLKPKSVCRYADGIVITTWSRLAESRGYVIAPEGTQLDTSPGSDPAYRLRHPGLYSFVIRG